jgi:hypothetical protein
MANYKFLNQYELTHASASPTMLHRSSHNQAPRAPPLVSLGHHTDRVGAERGDMVNHQNLKITISLGPPANDS